MTISRSRASRPGEDAAAREEALRRQLLNAAAQWRATFDAIAAPILVLDTSGRVLRLNRAARDLTGREYAGLIGQPANEVGGGPLFPAVAELAARAAANRSAAESRVLDQARSTIWELVAHFRGRDKELDDEQVIVVATDVTRLEALQESLRKSETLSALGSMVAGVAHQVRSPLFGISAALDAFEARFGDREEMLGYLKALREPATRLSRLIEELIEYARPAVVDKQAVDVREVVAEAVRSCAALARRHQVTVATLTGGEPLLASLDRSRAQSAFVHLIENAIAMTPQRGTVDVTVQAVLTAGRPWAVCRISDSGPGFSPEDVPRLGEPFFSRRHGSTGLGLALVKRVVFEHGGVLRFGSAPGGGAEVEVRFPPAAGGRES